jgi:hypothetical protein
MTLLSSTIRANAGFHMNMLNPHELRAAAPQTAQSLHLRCVGAQQSGRRGGHRGNTLIGSVGTAKSTTNREPDHRGDNNKVGHDHS